MSDEKDKDLTIHESPEASRTIKPLKTLRIEISGPTHSGKTALTILLAKTLQTVFDELGVITPLVVSNLDGDYPAAYKMLNTRLADLIDEDGRFAGVTGIHLIDCNGINHSVPTQGYVGPAILGPIPNTSPGTEQSASNDPD